MQPWIIVTITLGFGFAFFGFLFWLKNRKNKRMDDMHREQTQVVVQSQPVAQPQTQQNFSTVYQPQQQQQPPYPQQSYPPQYQQNQPYPPQQQIGFTNPPTVGFVPQQSPFIPSTSNTGAVHARDPQAYYNPNLPRNIAITMHNTVPYSPAYGARTFVATTTTPSAPPAI